MKVNTIDDYISLQPGEDFEALEKIRSVIKSAAPAAVETISYNMPAFKLNGMLVGFANWKNHIGFYPWNSTTVKVFEKELQAYQTSKGAIQFQKNQPLPVALIKKIVKTRIQENNAKEKQRKSR